MAIHITKLPPLAIADNIPIIILGKKRVDFELKFGRRYKLELTITLSFVTSPLVYKERFEKKPFEIKG